MLTGGKASVDRYHGERKLPFEWFVEKIKSLLSPYTNR